MATAATRELQAPRIGELELVEGWFESDPTARVRFALPISAAIEATGTTVVYAEVDPGNTVPPHIHTGEETVVVLEGTAEAYAGEMHSRVSAGAIVLKWLPWAVGAGRAHRLHTPLTGDPA